MNKNHNKPENENQEIEIEDIRKCLLQAGYFLEGRTKEKFQKAGFATFSSTAFIDRYTGKVRELDLEALKLEPILDTEHCFLGYLIAWECKSRSQPLILFKDKNQDKASNELSLHLSGHPQTFFGNPTIDVADIYDYHRYWQKEICFQYCTFSKNGKGVWSAGHDDEDHNAFRTLIQGLRQRIKEDNDRWSEFPVYLRLAFPLFVVKGKMFLAEESREDVKLIQTSHALLRIEDIEGDEINPGSRRNYFVDIVCEEYLEEWIEKLGQELKMLKEKMGDKKERIFQELERRNIKVRRIPPGNEFPSLVPL